MQWNARMAAFAALIGVGVVAVQTGQAQSDRFSTYWGPKYTAPPPLLHRAGIEPRATTSPDADGDMIHHWNVVAIDTAGLDHEAVAAGESRRFGEQLGPGRSSRAMAIVHIAIFDAVNAISHRYTSFTGIADAPAESSTDAAIAQAAHDTLVALYPSQRDHCDRILADDLAAIPNGNEKVLGIEAGRRAANAILNAVRKDGSEYDEVQVGDGYLPGDQPGEWRPDPVSGSLAALGAHWGEVRPLIISSAAAHRVPPPPALDSAAYAAAFEDVKRLGGDGVVTPTARTNDQTMTGIYWAYDGTPSLCAPPRLYNQMVVHIARQMGTTDTVELARLLALVNVAMADAGIASWESKYYWKLWRPVTAIREADPGTGPSGLGDGNPATLADPTFTPLGAPASNLIGPDFTPPFPAYPSGHATFGGAVFQMLRNFYRTDDIAFTFVSDELNGETRDNHGAIRPLLPRTFASLSQAEEENGQSRIYLGIHWNFDKTAGIAQGRGIADEVFTKAARRR